MKKLLIASLIGLLPTLLNAQQIAKNNKIKSPAELTATTNGTNVSAKELRKAEREKFLFAKTTKAFNRDFKNASDVQWSASKSQYTASFTKDNVKTVAWYTKGGNLTYTMHTYNAEKLPSREQDVIASEYDDYKIKLVNEVHQNDIVVYVVHLENDRNIKLVTVCDGYTNIYREYRKQ
jgi:hypothetical protein